jgi:hypothetical protein
VGKARKQKIEGTKDIPYYPGRNEKGNVLAIIYNSNTT